MINILSIDVEDYWSIFSRDWLGQKIEPTDAVVRNTRWFLNLLGNRQIRGTFFILGEVARKFPALVKQIANEGHEIGVHGFLHKQIFKLNRDEFRQEIADCKKMLEDIIAGKVNGHRAPAFSITPQTKWAFEILAEEGFSYDSSVYPITGRRYGWPKFSQTICKVKLSSGQSIIEVPMTTIKILGQLFPVAGGGYFRHFPYAITRTAMKHIQKHRPAVVYMHPYEIDTEERDFDVSGLSEKDRGRVLRLHKLQLRNRATVADKLSNLLSDFKFAAIADVLAQARIDNMVDIG